MQGRYNIFFCWNPNSQLWSLNRTHPLTCCNLRPRKALLQLQIEGATKPEIESILQVAQSRQQSVYLLHHITLPLEQQFENSVQVEHSTQLCSTLDTSPKQHHYRQGCSLAHLPAWQWSSEYQRDCPPTKSSFEQTSVSPRSQCYIKIAAFAGRKI